MIDQLHPVASIECFTRWTPLNIQMGASDLDCRTAVVDRGGSFRLHNRLHAKYYRFDNQVLVGSANLTAAGLSYPRDGNLEILCEPEPPFVAATFEAKLRGEAKNVTDDDFRAWQQCPVLEPVAVISTEELLIAAWTTGDPRREILSTCGCTAAEMRNRSYPKSSGTWHNGTLEFLRVPSGLTSESFRGWIRLSLEASPFMDSVRRFGRAG